MSDRDLLLELEEPLSRLSYGINAIELMVSGLEQQDDPYADGFFAVWTYLRDAHLELEAVLTAVGEA